VKMLSLFDYKNTSVALGEERKSNSAIAQYEFDCNGQQSREIANSFYSGHMGGGSIVYSKVDVRKWTPISKRDSGSLFFLWQSACKNS